MKSDLTKSVRKLVETETTTEQVVAPVARGALPAEVSRSSTPAAQSGGGGGGGGDLTETAYADRTYHPDVTFSTSDGFVTWLGKPVARFKFLDADQNVVYHNYKAPPAA